MIRVSTLSIAIFMTASAFAQQVPERVNPFEAPTPAEVERMENERRMQEQIQRQVQQAVQQSQQQILRQVQEDAKVAAAKAEQDALSRRGAVSGPGAFGGPLKPGERPRAPIAQLSQSGTVMAVNPNEPTGLEPVLPENYKHVSCINGRAIYTDGKATFQLETGQSRGLCAR